MDQVIEWKTAYLFFTRIQRQYFCFSLFRCISQGSAIRQQSETIEIDWTRLLHMDPSENQFRPAVSEEDMGLFFNNVKMDEIHISLPDNHQDSHFVTLAAEPATVLEASTSSDLSQRRLTASVG